MSCHAFRRGAAERHRCGHDAVDFGQVVPAQRQIEGSDAGTLTVRRGPAPDGDAVVTMSADTLSGLLAGQMTVTDAVRHATVDGGTEIARRALEPLAAAGAKPAPSPAAKPPGS